MNARSGIGFGAILALAFLCSPGRGDGVRFPSSSERVERYLRVEREGTWKRIAWRGEIHDALREATATERPLFVQFTARQGGDIASPDI